MEIKSKLRLILVEKDIKQRDLAQKIGISQSTLSLLVRGKTLPTLEVAYKISIELRMPVESIWVVEMPDCSSN